MSKLKEVEFAKAFPEKTIEYSNREQDMFEHWDVKMDGIKIDVKAMKRINRHDEHPTNLFNFIEIKNVRGNKGWAYGDADAFAFETHNLWILVSKKEIQKIISDKVKRIPVKRSADALYKIYTRFGRQDEVTMVHMMDLVEVAYCIRKKKK